jgi:hypothetical protein
MFIMIFVVSQFKEISENIELNEDAKKNFKNKKLRGLPLYLIYFLFLTIFN